jgi:hypothetical protein
MGISHVAVQHAVKAGRIHTVMGKIDPAQADHEWLENTDQSKWRNRITGQPKGKRAPGAPSAPMDLQGPDKANGGTSGGNGTASYAEARTRRETANARLAELALEEKRKKLVSADEVELAAFQEARKVRDQLLALSERVAVILAATPDPAEVQRILDDEIDRICLEIAGGEA